jgi:hypothetical protein
MMAAQRSDALGGQPGRRHVAEAMVLLASIWLGRYQIGYYEHFPTFSLGARE